MAMTESQKKYEQKRMKDCKTFTAKYRLYIDQERKEKERLQRYLTDTNQTANAYIKALIKTDLDQKGV